MNPLLTADLLGTPVWLWLGFATLVLALLALDLGVLHRGQREIGVRESLGLSAGYIGIALAFGAGVWALRGEAAGVAWLTGYVIEKSLSMDNVFVIAMIFGALAIPRALQHRVLFWGILGVIVLRALLIGLGAALVSRFDWVLLVFGVFLLITGARMWAQAGSGHDPSLHEHPLLAWLRRHLRLTPQLHGPAFLVRAPHPQTGQPVRWATPLLLALVMVECMDLVFAVDSVPAIFAITTDPFIVYSSNIFAILGLRALYFALAALMHRFRYLGYALALVLVFVGGKILYGGLVGHVPPLLSLAVTASLLAGGVLVSMWKTRGGALPTERGAAGPAI